MMRLSLYTGVDLFYSRQMILFEPGDTHFIHSIN
jgi:hypothetical protein